MIDPKKPPDNCRDVLVLLLSGLKVKGYFWKLDGHWYVQANGRPRAVTIQGWEEMPAETHGGGYE